MTERNRMIAELAQLMWQRCHPKAARQVHGMDEKTVSDYYGMASDAITFCEERLPPAAQPGQPRSDSPVMSGEPHAASEGPSPEEPGDDLRVSDVLAPDNPEIDEEIPF